MQSGRSGTAPPEGAAVQTRARAALALTASLIAAAAAAAAPSPHPYGKNEGGFLNILPPGQDGHADAAQVLAFSGLASVFGSGNAPPQPHSRDQLDRYANLVYASPTLASSGASPVHGGASLSR